MRRVVVSLTLLLLVAASPTVLGVDARTSIPEGMCSLWTARQATSAMGERMEVVRDDPDACVWYSRDDHSGSISTLSASLWGGDPGSDVPLVDQARGQSWRDWTSEETVGGAPMLLTDVRRARRNREITAAAFPDDITWLDLNATSVIGKDVRRAVRRMVEIAAPKLAATAPSSAPAPSGSTALPQADACALLTEDEVSAALGEAMFANEMPPTACLFAGSPASGSPTNLALAVLQGDDAASAIAQFEGLGFTELTVGGVPAHQSPPDVSNGRSRSVLAVLPDPTTVLALSVDVPEAIDAPAAARTLAELALPRLVTVPAPSAAPSPVGSGIPPIADACSLLTADEVSEAIGETMSQSDSATDQCIWSGDQSSFLNLTILPADDVDATTSMIDRRRALSPDVEDIEVAGLPGLFEVGPLLGVPSVYVYPSATTEVELELVAMREFDTRAALEALAALAVPRLGALPGPSTAPASPAASAPAPSTAARSGLAALFPAEIGGGPVTIDSELTGREFLAQIVNFDPMEQQVTRALRRRDRTVGDLSFAIGGTGSGSVIAAFQVEGGPLRPLVNTLLASLAMERTGQDVPAASVAGKDAFEVSGGFLIGGQGIAYPAGEVLWLVFPVGDEQTEIFEKLP